MKYNTITLDNGLRVIHLPSASPVVYCGYEIAAGSRDEEAGEEGLAHFCEHTTFKGTERRKAWHILNCLESVGGDLNAFTNKEETVYHAAILKEHLPRAVDLLTDIVFHSVYPQSEMGKEIAVICDEIESYNDSPAELIYDEFENILFEGHPLGHNILGTAPQLRTYTSADALRFSRRHYRPDNAVFFAYGDVDFGKLVKLLNGARGGETASQKNGNGERKAANGSPQRDSKISTALHSPEGSHCFTRSVARNKFPAPRIEKEMHTHQSHVMLGCRAYDVQDKRRMPLYLLNNILGGPGMNARLNLALRERNALVYSVDSAMNCYSDTGVWSTYFGCDPHDVEHCLHLVRKELDRVMQKPLSATQLRAAQKQIKGQIGVACDSREQFALDFGKSFLHYGWEKDVTSLYNDIDNVTPAELQQVAQELFSEDNLTTLIYK